MELFEKLGLDGKLLLAQVVNFAILLAVLAKFVYRPVLDMLEKRSKLIEKGIHDAKESEARLMEVEKMKEEKMAQTHRDIGRLFDEARTDAEALKKGIIAAATAQSEELLRRARIEIQAEKTKMMADLKKGVAEVVVAATGKMLCREFSEADQARLTEAISKEVQSL